MNRLRVPRAIGAARTMVMGPIDRFRPDGSAYGTAGHMMGTPAVRAIRRRAKEVILNHVPGIYWRYFDARFGEDGIEAEMPLLPILADRS